MTLFKDTDILYKNPDFELLAEGDDLFFILKSGHKVQTDKIGKAIWEYLPGTLKEIQTKIQNQYSASSLFVEEFLFILLRAEIVQSKIDANSPIDKPSPFKDFETPKDLISAIIVTCNSMEHIEECLASLKKQTYTNLEILVVDNHSTDETVAFIRENFPNVIVHALKKNLYYPGGLNYGMKQAKGDYFLVLNDDVALDRDCIFYMYEKMKEDETTGGVVPMMKFYNLRGFINGIGNHMKNYGWGSDNFIGCVDIGQFANLKEVPSACISTYLAKKETVLNAGYLDSKYIAYYEDVDWSFRFWLCGWKIVPAEKALVYHKFGAFWKTMERKLKMAIRNRQRLVLKIFQGKILYGFVKRYVKEDLKNALSLLKRKEFSMVFSYPKAYFSLFLMLPDIYLKRRKIMRKKLKTIREKDIIEKNPDFFSALNTKNIPIVDSSLYFRYYRWEFRKQDYRLED